MCKEVSTYFKRHEAVRTVKSVLITSPNTLLIKTFDTQALRVQK